MIPASFVLHTLTEPVARAEIAAAKEKAAKDKAKRREKQKKYRERVFADDAKVKCKVKVVATSFPFAMKVVYPRAKKNGGGFDVIPYPGK